MKQTINIIAFFFVLAIPFALSSQTRKAIPAGRYEALSGVKNSRTVKVSETQNADKKDSSALFWSEVINHLPENKEQATYFSLGQMDDFSTNLLATKGLKTSKKLKAQTDIIFSDDLKRDREIFRKFKNKNGLVVLKDSQELKDVMATLAQFEVLLYQAEDKSNYFLLKMK